MSVDRCHSLCCMYSDIYLKKIFCIGIPFKIFLSMYVSVSYITYLITNWHKWHCINNPSNVCDWPYFFSTVVWRSYINTVYKMRDHLKENYSSYNMLFFPLYPKNNLKWVILIFKIRFEGTRSIFTFFPCISSSATTQ